MPHERCHRCHTILTSEDKHSYGIACESCETDLKWEEYEHNLTIKSAHWRWRSICFGLRVLWHYPGRLRDVLLRKLRRRNMGIRSERTNGSGR